MMFGGFNSFSRAFLVLVIAFLFVSNVSPGFCAGTGDEPSPTEDVLTPQEAKEKVKEEAKYQVWLKGLKNSGSQFEIQIVDAPYKYLYTPNHEQERAYWCGPATCQIIDDYWGSYVSQSTYASYMGTTRDGTDFSKVDDCLRHFTGKSYYYYGPLKSESDFYSRVQYAILTKGYPMAADAKILGDKWPYYVYDHNGHIFPIEGFDWRYDNIRINDPYDESRWKSGGGDTLGHKVYKKDIIWGGIEAHWRKAVIY